MSPLFAPVFAQLITIGVYDRTEARHVTLSDAHYEAQTTPGASLTLAWRHSDLALRYAVSLLVLPLESKSREWLPYHTVGLNASYRLRRTSFGFTNTTSFGALNFQTATLNGAQAAADPAAPEATPGEPASPETVPQVYVANRTVHRVVSITSFDAVHGLDRNTTLSGGVRYSLAAGSGADAEREPRVAGLAFTASLQHSTKLSAHDSATLNIVALDNWSSSGNHATTTQATDTWQHALDRHTSTILGAGLSVLRLHQDSGLTAFTILPTLFTGLDYSSLAGRGRLTLQLRARSAPAPDPLRGTVDPRLTGLASVGWARDRFSSAMSGYGAASLAPRENNSGALDAYGASTTAGYRFTDWLSAEVGARLARQNFEGTTQLPLSYAVFVALSVGYDWKLNRRH